MLNHELVLMHLKAALKPAPESVEIEPLKGDASNRSYYRLRLSGRTGPASLILMELAEPESFKESEERVSPSQGKPPIEELPFINILGHLKGVGVSVPELIHFEPESGLLYLEDLGDRTLEQAVLSDPDAAIRQLYPSAVDEIIKIQSSPSPRDGKDCLAFYRRFDLPLLMWEFDHFLEYGIETRLKTRIGNGDRNRIRQEFERIGRILSAEPLTLTHRDFHSRNLMIHGGRVLVLDFQDALMGPAVYDLASLLRDSYVVLPEPAVDQLIEFYRERSAEAGGGKRGGDEFRRVFDLMSIQRNLKAAGRFVYIDAIKGKNHLLPYVAQTIGYVRRNLQKYDELKKLRGWLEPYLKETA